jgi:poly(A) polymerase
MDRNISKLINKLKKISSFRELRVINDLSQKENICVYLVGGFLRDLYLDPDADMKSFDRDFAVESDALLFAKKAAARLKADYVVLDKGQKTARVISEHCRIDFAGFKAKTIKQDLKKRDFTVNTLCADVSGIVNKQPELIGDPRAAADLKDKVLRAVSSNAFKDDPLRILRGFAFLARLKFRFDKRTLGFIALDKKRLETVSPERTTEELGKIFSADDCYESVALMDAMGILEIVLPEIKPLKGVDQGKFHHLDVWQHSLESLLQLEELLKDLPGKISKKNAILLQEYLQSELCANRSRLWMLKLGCILHDIAKPITKFVGRDKKVHFYTHEKKGAEIVKKIGKRLRFSNKENAVLSNIVLYHLRAGQLVNRRPTKRAKFRFLRDAKQNAPMIILLTLADRQAMQGIMSKSKEFVFYEDELFKLLSQYFKNKKAGVKKPRLLNGHELISLLGLPKGPVIGDILRQIEEAQALKSIKDKKQAKQLACDIYAKMKK